MTLVLKALAVGYLLVAFLTNDWNPSIWDSEQRTWSLVAAFIVWLFWED